MWNSLQVQPLYRCKGVKLVSSDAFGDESIPAFLENT